jgi:hypothetical protein
LAAYERTVTRDVQRARSHALSRPLVRPRSTHGQIYCAGASLGALSPTLPLTREAGPPLQPHKVVSGGREGAANRKLQEKAIAASKATGVEYKVSEERTPNPLRI